MKLVSFNLCMILVHYNDIMSHDITSHDITLMIAYHASFWFLFTGEICRKNKVFFHTDAAQVSNLVVCLQPIVTSESDYMIGCW